MLRTEQAAGSGWQLLVDARQLKPESLPSNSQTHLDGRTVLQVDRPFVFSSLSQTQEQTLISSPAGPTLPSQMSESLGLGC